MARPDPAFEDLTARARIREAALTQFAEHGFQRATIRGIAAAAGVSAGLVRHHFGSKEALRDAVDAYVIETVRRVNEENLVDQARGDLSRGMLARAAMRPFQAYLARALVDGSKTIAALFDSSIGPTEQWLAVADEKRPDAPYIDRRTRAAVFTAMVFGVPLMREHLTRVLGVDIFSPEGDRRLVLALMDIYSHPIVSPELAASAIAAMGDT